MTTDEISVAAATDSPPDWRTRSAAWFPWAVVAALAVLVVGTVLITHNHPEEPPYPHDQLDGAIGLWVFQYVFPIIWLGLLVFFITQLVKTGKFSMPGLMFIAATTMFWIEWPADWGSFLVYNRELAQIPGWTSTWFQTYWKPIGVIFGYGVFFAVECTIMLKVVPRVSSALRRVIPVLKSTPALIVSCIAVFYVIDQLGEGMMTALGWYSYAEPVGPHWSIGDRGLMPFFWPAIPFLLFAVGITLLLRTDADGNRANEKFFRVHTLEQGYTREFSRLAVWIITMNVVIFVAQPLILVIGRILFFNDPSLYHPW